MDEEKVVTDEITDEEITANGGNAEGADDSDSLDALLQELDSDEEKSDEEQEEVDDTQKQINDLKAQLGRVAKAKKEEKKEEPKEEVKEEPKEVKFDVNSAMAEDLLIANNPEVKNILPTLKAHAEKLGTSVYELYKTDDTYKTMAQSFKTEESEEEKNINKINKPSGAAFSGKTVENVTDEDMEKMTNEQRLKVLTELQKREGLN